MSATNLGPPFDAAGDVLDRLRERGFAVVEPAVTAALLGTSLEALDGLRASWNDLPSDRYLKDGGAYRRRRHACFVVDSTTIERTPHRAHWQPVEYNALHGGMRRWFEPVDADVVDAAAWRRLLLGLAELCTRLRPVPAWSVEAHQFRIDTAGGIGRPTPEGAHRDGVDFVAVLLVARRGVKGGETRVFDAAGPNGVRFTMTAPWTMLLLDDARVLHETTPIQPADGDAADGLRDTLVVTLRAGGFQGDDATTTD